MIGTDEFLELMRNHLTPARPLLTRLGTIPATYSGSGLPTVQFDGESAPSTRTYPRAHSYTPAAGDRVLLIGHGSTWVVLCKVVTS